MTFAILIFISAGINLTHLTVIIAEVAKVDVSQINRLFEPTGAELPITNLLLSSIACVLIRRFLIIEPCQLSPPCRSLNRWILIAALIFKFGQRSCPF